MTVSNGVWAGGGGLSTTTRTELGGWRKEKSVRLLLCSPCVKWKAYEGRRACINEDSHFSTVWIICFISPRNLVSRKVIKN